MTEQRLAEHLLRRRILDAAAAEFARSGYSAAEIDAVAAGAASDAETIRGTIGDKADLYRAVLLDLLTQVLALIAPVAAIARSPEGRLRATIAGITALISDKPYFARLLLREIASGGASLPNPVVAHMQLLFRILAHALSQGAAGGVFRPVDPFITQMALAGSLLVVTAAAPIARKLGTSEPPSNAAPSEIAAAVSDLLLDGLRPHPSRRLSRKSDDTANGRNSRSRRSR